MSLLLVASAAFADDLGDANKFLNAKDYGKAFPIYARLAQSGNAEAQLRVGEMYWFGEGTRADLKKAEEWLGKSAAAGNADAATSLAALKRRASRGNEIAYWTTTYAGEDMVSGQFACKRPAIPAVSKTNTEIKSLAASMDQWRNCYNNFVANLNDAMPPGKRIPAEVLDMMTPAEATQAQRHLDQVYAKLAADAARDAETFAREESAWRTATDNFVLQENANTGALRDEMSRYRSRNADVIGQLHREPRTQQ
jgi:TPR repeat protein